jgi:hypothetical protein
VSPQERQEVLSKCFDPRKVCHNLLNQPSYFPIGDAAGARGQAVAGVLSAAVVKAATDEVGQDPCVSSQRVCLHLGQQADHDVRTPG